MSKKNLSHHGQKNFSAPSTESMSKRRIDTTDFHSFIQKRAYEIFQHRNQQNLPGDALSDWFQAENEIKSEDSFKNDFTFKGETSFTEKSSSH